MNWLLYLAQTYRGVGELPTRHNMTYGTLRCTKCSNPL